jgi:hypothetical protein
MYRCTSDHSKLVICAALPRGPAECILGLNECNVQLPAREKKNAMLRELVKNERFIFLRLVHEVFDKYTHDTDGMLKQWYYDAIDHEIDVSLHIRFLAFDLQMYHNKLDEADRWGYYQKMILSCKYKNDYSASMRLMLS